MEVPLMGKHSSIDATKNIDQIKSCLPLQTIKIARKSRKKQKENRAGCAGEGKQRKGNIREEKRTVDSVKFDFCDEITRRCEG